MGHDQRRGLHLLEIVNAPTMPANLSIQLSSAFGVSDAIAQHGPFQLISGASIVNTVRPASQ